MTKKLQMSPDVLIYLQSIKNFFTNNTLAKKYFSIEGNEEIFYKHISELSQKNFDEYGEPELTLDQFEELRKSIFSSEDDITFTASFLNLGDLGYISLN
jgi:hypothetical protein